MSCIRQRRIPASWIAFVPASMPQQRSPYDKQALFRRLLCGRSFGHLYGLRRPRRGSWRAQRIAGSGTRSEERRVGKECVVRVDLGGRRILKKKKQLYMARVA